MVKEAYKKAYEDFCKEAEWQYYDPEDYRKPSKYEWIAVEVFDLCTYDSALDELFAKQIVEVCEQIINKTQFEYIKIEEQYIKYIAVCQWLSGHFNWLEWGTSIRGCWFADFDVKKPLLSYGQYNAEKIDFTVENLKKLIEFIKEE